MLVWSVADFIFDLCSLLLRRECCTFSNGEYVKAGLAELELWCCQAKEEVISPQTDASACLPTHYFSYCFSYISAQINNLASNIANLLPCTLQYAGSAWDELKHIRQSVGFLVCSSL